MIDPRETETTPDGNPFIRPDKSAVPPCRRKTPLDIILLPLPVPVNSAPVVLSNERFSERNAAPWEHATCMRTCTCTRTGSSSRSRWIRGNKNLPSRWNVTIERHGNALNELQSRLRRGMPEMTHAGITISVFCPRRGNCSRSHGIRIYQTAISTGARAYAR